MQRRLEAKIAELCQRAKELEDRVSERETENAARRAVERQLRRENVRLKRTNRRLADENRLLRREVLRLGGSVAPAVEEAEAAAEAIDQNEAKAEVDPLPASSAPDQKGRGRGRGRKRGGQPCHAGTTRALVCPEKVDRAVALIPAECSKCAKPLVGTDPKPSLRQVVEIPEPTVHVTQYEQHSLQCACGTVTKGEVPPGVPRGPVAFGPRLQALVALLSGGCRLSKRTIQGLFFDLYGLKISLGSISNCERAVSESLERPVRDAHDYAQQQIAANVDETGWLEGKLKAYLWSMVTTWVTIFMIRATRCRDTANELLGSFKGALITDRLKTYYYWPIFRHQFCWAHLKRRFEEFLLASPEARAVGEGLLADNRLMFSWWHRVRDGTLKRATFRTYMTPLRQRVRALLEQGAACPDPEVAGTCHELLAKFEALWTFVRVEGVEPTNNAAERALRHGVLWRRASFGTDSKQGSVFVERVLTTVTSLGQQNRNAFSFLAAACTARLQGTTPPSLLPPAELLHAHDSAA